jgi:Ser/Thr protein kinase RdoA (MazF antagonist)
VDKAFIDEECGMDPATERVLAFVNDAHGLRYRCVRRLAGGIQAGAYELRDPADRPAVLKWSTRRDWAEQMLRAVPAVRRVRERGWPTPAWLAAGTTPDGLPYQVQEFVVGTPMERVGPDELALVLDLNARQAGLDPDPGRDWTMWNHDVLFDGRDGYVDRARAIGPEVARVVDRLLAASSAYRGQTLPNTDLVHGDLHPGNIIVADGVVVGVVDIEALGSGSRAIDLSGLLLGTYGDDGEPVVRRGLRDAILAAAGEAGLVLFGVMSAITGLTFFEGYDARRIPGACGSALRWLEDNAPPRRSAG